MQAFRSPFLWALCLLFMGVTSLDLTVKTKTGMITGHRAPKSPKVYEYLGIPFAKAPISDLRFAPPAKLLATTSSVPYIADKFSQDCPQTPGNPVAYPERTPQFQQIVANFGNQLGNPMGEDCLYLNVWSKASSKKKKPVLVFFYGGRWSIGGTNTAFYNGKYLADTEDVVVVTINFRLNIFGYPGVPGGSQNLGLQDQRVAVEWIRDNVAAFAGDASKITIFGQSSGGLAADFWSYAYKKDPIVAGIVSHSGNAYSFPLNTLELAEKNWYNASERVGCGSSGDNLECMRKVDWDLIRAAAARVPPPPGTSQARSQPPFQATIDEIRVFSDYYERSEAGNHARIPYLVGHTHYEAGYYKVPAFGQGRVLNESVWTDFNLECFTCASALEASQRAKNKVPVWRYRYHGDWNNTRLFPTSGAYHGVDLHMIFGASEEVSGLPESQPQTHTKRIMQKMWASFAADPAKGLSRLGFPMYDPNKNTLIQLALANRPIPSLDKANTYDGDCAKFLPSYQQA